MLGNWMGRREGRARSAGVFFRSHSTPPLLSSYLQIDADVEESRTVVKYMRRCCLFFLCSCCCECDPDAERDRMRRARVKARRTAKKQEADARARVAARREADAAGKEGVVVAEEATEESARAALFGGKAKPQRKGGEYQIGQALAGVREREGGRVAGRTRLGGRPHPSLSFSPDPDRDALNTETDAQELAFDRIGGALADLKRLGGDMQTELARQDGAIDRVGNHAQKARDDILHVSKSAAKGFGVKPARGRRRGRGERRGGRAAHAADPPPPLAAPTSGASTSAAAARVAGKAAAKAAGKSLGL